LLESAHKLHSPCKPCDVAFNSALVTAQVCSLVSEYLIAVLAQNRARDSLPQKGSRLLARSILQGRHRKPEQTPAPSGS
jgi:hypothetical protein